MGSRGRAVRCCRSREEPGDCAYFERPQGAARYWTSESRARDGALTGTVAAGDDRVLLMLKLGFVVAAVLLVVALVAFVTRHERDLARRVTDPQPSWPDISKPEIRG
jgi:hypothetical protein